MLRSCYTTLISSVYLYTSTYCTHLDTCGYSLGHLCPQKQHQLLKPYVYHRMSIRLESLWQVVSSPPPLPRLENFGSITWHPKEMAEGYTPKPNKTMFSALARGKWHTTPTRLGFWIRISEYGLRVLLVDRPLSAAYHITFIDFSSSRASMGTPTRGVVLV